jgi:hypothetical protein
MVILQQMHMSHPPAEHFAALPCRELSDEDNATRRATWEELRLRQADGARGDSGGRPGPLLPELAQLQWLEVIEINIYSQTLYSGIPPEWGLPGAFPRLKR